MENNVKVQDDTQSLQSCVSVSVTELRIGNLVELDNKESWLSFANLPMIVTEIDSKLSQKEKEIWNKSDGTISLKYKYETFNQFSQFIKPIPLTEEWLLKFGYEKDGEFFDNETRLNFWTNKNTFNGILADWADKTIGEVKYIHQLQNLYYALTGSELQIGNLTEH